MKDFIIPQRIVVFALMAVVLLSPMLVSIAEASPRSKTIFFDDFTSRSLSSSWIVEKTGLGGTISLSKGVLTLTTPPSGTVGASVTIYRHITPPTNGFTLSARVSSSQLTTFALRIHCGSPPIFWSTNGAQYEIDNGVENKQLMAVWESPSGWTWTNVYGPSLTNTWYTIEMKVKPSPFTITWNVYNSKGKLLGTYTTTNLGISYSSISYVCLEVWNGPASYHIDWVKATN